MVGSRLLPLVFAGLVALAGALPARADEAPSPAQTEAMEKVIHDYLLKHPEVVVEALKAYDAGQQAAEAERQQQTIAARQKELQQDDSAPVAGNPAGRVTVVEFFDYRCPYCKAVAKDMLETLQADPDVRIVFKEFPILGAPSTFAAKAALAAHRQGKYLDFHEALMLYKGELSEAIVLDIANKSGLDVARLQEDMKRPEIEASIRRNYDLAAALNIRGTPAFVVGDQLYPGALSMDTLKRLVDGARKG